MENNSSFKFQFIERHNYTKENRQMARIVAYCSYGFVTYFYTSIDKADKLMKLLEENKTKDMTKYVYVFYDNKTDKFRYIINFK